MLCPHRQHPRRRPPRLRAVAFSRTHAVSGMPRLSRNGGGRRDRPARRLDERLHKLRPHRLSRESRRPAPAGSGADSFAHGPLPGIPGSAFRGGTRSDPARRGDGARQPGPAALHAAQRLDLSGAPAPAPDHRLPRAHRRRHPRHHGRLLRRTLHAGALFLGHRRRHRARTRL